MKGLTDLVLAACDQYDYGEWHEAFNDGINFQDAIFCPYDWTMGFIVFSSVFMLGGVYAPIYIRQGSPLIPFVISLILAGIWLSTGAAWVQNVIVLTTLLVVTVAPYLVLRSLRSP